jgi:hypothetical protein
MQLVYVFTGFTARRQQCGCRRILFGRKRFSCQPRLFSGDKEVSLQEPSHRTPRILFHCLLNDGPVITVAQHTPDVPGPPTQRNQQNTARAAKTRGSHDKRTLIVLIHSLCHFRDKRKADSSSWRGPEHRNSKGRLLGEHPRCMSGKEDLAWLSATFSQLVAQARESWIAFGELLPVQVSQEVAHFASRNCALADVVEAFLSRGAKKAVDIIYDAVGPVGPPVRPGSGSLFIVDERRLKNWRDDGCAPGVRDSTDTRSNIL